MEHENEILDEEISTISLTDEEGNEIDLELVDTVDYQGAEYLILLPPDDDEVIILEVEPQADGTECYLSVDDEDVLNAVFGIFKEHFQDFFTFED